MFEYQSSGTLCLSNFSRNTRQNRALSLVIIKNMDKSKGLVTTLKKIFLLKFNYQWVQGSKGTIVPSTCPTENQPSLFFFFPSLPLFISSPVSYSGINAKDGKHLELSRSKDMTPCFLFKNRELFLSSILAAVMWLASGSPFDYQITLLDTPVQELDRPRVEGEFLNLHFIIHSLLKIVVPKACLRSEVFQISFIAWHMASSIKPSIGMVVYEVSRQEWHLAIQTGVEGQ